MLLIKIGIQNAIFYLDVFFCFIFKLGKSNRGFPPMRARLFVGAIWRVQKLILHKGNGKYLWQSLTSYNEPQVDNF